MAVITRDGKCVDCRESQCLNCRDPGKKRKWQPIPDELSLVRIELINDVLKTLERIKENQFVFLDADYDVIDANIKELKGWLKDA
jgi:hypothetical protein